MSLWHRSHLWNFISLAPLTVRELLAKASIPSWPVVHPSMHPKLVQCKCRTLCFLRSSLQCRPFQIPRQPLLDSLFLALAAMLPTLRWVKILALRVATGGEKNHLATP